MTTKPLPPKELKISINENTYTVKFPDTRQFIEIESLKIRLAQNEEGPVWLGNNADHEAGYAKLLIDMIATYNVLIPELKKDINTETWLGLSMLESRELLDPYMNSYLPWYMEWMEIITKVKPKQAEL